MKSSFLRSHSENGAAFVEAAVVMFFLTVLLLGTFDLLQVAKVAIKAQQVAEMSARVGAVASPEDGSAVGSVPQDDQLFIGSGAYLPEWRIFASAGKPPVAFEDRELKALNLGLGYSQVVFPNYTTVDGFSANDWGAGSSIPNREIAILPMHYTDPAYSSGGPGSVRYVTYRVCVGTELTLAGLVNVCRQATMPAY